MRGVEAQVRRAAESDVTVLITGESGSGKEFVARAIHEQSARAKSPWMPVNCGTLRPELVDSELFGHEKGAFTGANDRRPGLVEVTRSGTILLDEVAELPLPAQVSLLRFLESKEYRRVGGTEILTSNARLIAATNRDLERYVEQGAFREDLYYRLAVLTIRVPPLRERPEDIPVLVEHFLKQRGSSATISPSVMRSLQTRPWRGNLRELRNALDRLLLAGPDATSVPEQEALSPAADIDRPLIDVEKEHIRRVLVHHGWHQTKAAKTLGISTRTLYRKIRLFELEPS
jgi:DNA-binding NtrC family response regulator